MRISMRASAAAETWHCYFLLYLGDVGFGVLGSWGLGLVLVVNTGNGSFGVSARNLHDVGQEKFLIRYQAMEPSLSLSIQHQTTKPE